MSTFITPKEILKMLKRYGFIFFVAWIFLESRVINFIEKKIKEESKKLNELNEPVISGLHKSCNLISGQSLNCNFLFCRSPPHGL